MKKNEFRISEVPPGSVLLLGDVAVVQRRRGRAARLTIQRADGRRAVRPGEGSRKTYRVTVDGEVGRVDVPFALAVQSE